MAEPLAIEVGLMAVEQGIYWGGRVGTVFPSAMFYSTPTPLTLIAPDRAGSPMYRHKSEADYSVVAHCSHHGPEVVVLDFGMRACTQAFSPWADYQQGALYRGEVRLSFAPIFGFYEFVEHSAAPPLVYDWRVERIEIPEMEPSGIRWREVQEPPRQHNRPDLFILHCTALSDTPRRTLNP